MKSLLLFIPGAAHTHFSPSTWMFIDLVILGLVFSACSSFLPPSISTGLLCVPVNPSGFHDDAWTTVHIWKSGKMLACTNLCLFSRIIITPLNHEELLMGNGCIFRMWFYSSCLVLHWDGYNGNITLEALLPVSHINLKPSGTTVEKFNLGR